MKLLKKGGPCPCCGQPIRWEGPRLLRLLTYALNGQLTRGELDEMIALMKEELDEEKERMK